MTPHSTLSSVSFDTPKHPPRSPRPWHPLLVPKRYSGLKDWISQYIRKTDNILMVGAGSSRLTEDMYDDGYTTITNIDISSVVIEQMIARCR